MGETDDRDLARRVSLSRRQFLAGAAGAGAAAMLAGPLSGVASAAPGILRGNLGIQLFTVRDKVSSLGFAEVFETLASYGYKEIEFAGYTSAHDPGILPEDIKELLEEYELQAIGSHRNIDNFRTEAGRQEEIRIAKILGMPYLGTASAPSGTPTVAAYRAAAAEFNTWGADLAAAGLKFYQHNHAGEFAFATDQPGTRLYDVLLAETDPRLVYFEMDIYWAYVGQHLYPGFDPLTYLRNNRRRYPLFHVKDGTPNPANPNGYDFADVGDGVLPFDEFSADGRYYHHYVVERDNAPNPAINPPEVGGSFRTAERSAEYILENLRAV